LRQAASFVAAPLAALAVRAALAALPEAYLGRRSAARAQAGALRRGFGEIIRAALFYADLRDFTAPSEATQAAAIIAALDAWFDRVARAVHAFGGEVLKFIGDGVLAIFPVSGAPAETCEAALRGRRRTRRNGPSRCGAAGTGACRRCPSARRCERRGGIGGTGSLLLSLPPPDGRPPVGARGRPCEPFRRGAISSRPTRLAAPRNDGGELVRRPQNGAY
jgi:hypothetical protein